MSESIQRVKLCEIVSNRLVEYIRSQKWKEGEKIPSEPRLAELFDVSRSTIRLAVRMLQYAGVLYSKNGSGTYVKQGAVAVLESRELATVMKTPENVYELIQTRYIIEPELCGLAAQNATEEEIKELFSILSEMKQCQSRRLLMAHGYRFHQEVAKISHNHILYGFFESVATQLRGLRVLESLTIETFLQGVGEHQDIAKAIEKRDGFLAKELMREHLAKDYADFLK